VGNKGELITGLNEGKISNIQSKYYNTPRASVFWERVTGRQKCMKVYNNVMVNVR
jgi:hypothetical protein